MKKIILAILVVLWMAFIFNMSSENGDQSSNTSGQTIENVLSVVPEFEKQPEEVKKRCNFKSAICCEKECSLYWIYDTGDFSIHILFVNLKI